MVTESTGTNTNSTETNSQASQTTQQATQTEKPQQAQQAQTQQAAQPTEQTPWEQEKAQLSGKIQKLQNDLNSVTNGMSLEDAKYFLQTGVTMENLATQNPEFKERVLELVEKARTGTLTKREAEELDKKTVQMQKQEPSSPTQEQSWIRSKMQEEQSQREKFFADLEGTEREEINKENFFDKSVGRMRNLTREAVAINAQRFMKVNGLSEQEAYKKAYTLVRHPERLKEEGELEGISKALSTATTSTGVAGGAPKTQSTIEVPANLKEGYEYRLQKYGKERAEAFVRGALDKRK